MNTWSRDREVEKIKTTPAQRRKERRLTALKRDKEDIQRVTAAMDHAKYVLGDNSQVYRTLHIALGALMMMVNALEEAR